MTNGVDNRDLLGGAFGEAGSGWVVNANGRGGHLDSGLLAQRLQGIGQQGGQVTFAGNTDQAFASAFMELVRSGQIQLSGSF
jgi:hypothetical protein